MKNILIDILNSRIFQIGGVGCLLFLTGIYFYVQWNTARFEASLPKAPPQDPHTNTQQIANRRTTQDPQNTEDPAIPTVPRTRVNAGNAHTHADGRTHIHALTTPTANSAQQTEDTDKWTVMWPPDIPGLGIHPKRPRPPEIPIEVLSEISDIGSAVKRGELLRGDKTLVEDSLGLELSEAQYREVLEDIREAGVLTREEADQQQLEILADYWGLDLDNTEGFIRKMEEYQISPEAVMKRIEPELAFQTLFDWWNERSVTGITSQRLEHYAEHALSVNPNNVDAHAILAKTVKDYEAILDMDPNYYKAMDAIARLRYHDAPEEVIPLLEKSSELGSKGADMYLGWTYERLGDYKTAWTHYYKSLILQPDGQVSLMHMGAILRGEPRIEPIQRKTQTLPPAHGALDAQIDIDTDIATDGQSLTDTDTDWTSTPNQTETAETAYNAKAEAAKKAAQEFQKLQSQSQQEFEEFIDWLEHGINDAPDAQDFLSQQMKTFLTTKEPANSTNAARFAPERIIHAQETLEKYGHEEGLKRLEEDDPEIAKHIRRNPPMSRDKGHK